MPSHGSLTKAGKVRSQTPRIKGRPRINLSPRIRNRKEYIRHLSKKLEGKILSIASKREVEPIIVINEMMEKAKDNNVKQALRMLKMKYRVR